MHKKALVFGINNYQHFSVLESCINDANDMHTFLSENGFDSMLLLDVTQKDLISAVANFKKTLGENTISLIYFSGHGLQDDKHNYIVAADSEVNQVEDIKYNCFLADDLLVSGSRKNLHLLILDACRKNLNYTGDRSGAIGLLKMNAPAGTLIAFATSPNAASLERTGERNGIYTRNLLKNVQTPNLPVELVFKNTRNDVIKDTSGKQVPWEESSLFGGDFYFIQIEKETDEKKVFNLALETRDITLPELLPFLNKDFLTSASIEALFVLLTLAKISFTNEEDGTARQTIDSDYFSEILIDQYYPLFQNRVILEDKANGKFDLDILNKITIDKNINFGYGWSEDIGESFPQILSNYIKFDNKEGILSFYLSVENGAHFLKPQLILKNGQQLIINNYMAIIGEKVNELVGLYLKIREPFEKEIPDWSQLFTVEEIDVEEWDKLFTPKEPDDPSPQV